MLPAFALARPDVPSGEPDGAIMVDDVVQVKKTRTKKGVHKVRLRWLRPLKTTPLTQRWRHVFQVVLATATRTLNLDASDEDTAAAWVAALRALCNVWR